MDLPQWGGALVSTPRCSPPIGQDPPGTAFLGRVSAMRGESRPPLHECLRKVDGSEATIACGMFVEAEDWDREASLSASRAANGGDGA